MDGWHDLIYCVRLYPGFQPAWWRKWRWTSGTNNWEVRERRWLDSPKGKLHYVYRRSVQLADYHARNLVPPPYSVFTPNFSLLELPVQYMVSIILVLLHVPLIPVYERKEPMTPNEANGLSGVSADVVVEYPTGLPSKCDASARFLTAMEIYLNKPHVVNRRLVDAQFLSKADSSISSPSAENASVGSSVLQRRLYPRLQSGNAVEFGETVIKGVFRDPQEVCITTILRRRMCFDFSDINGVLIIFAKFCFSDVTSKTFTFKPWSVVKAPTTLHTWSSPSITYGFSLSPDGTVLRVCCANPKSEVEQKMVSWIHNSLASKILSWMQLEIDEDGSSATSLKLVNVQCYYEVYDSLKQKYAAGLKAVRPLFNRVFILKITRIWTSSAFKQFSFILCLFFII